MKVKYFKPISELVTIGSTRIRFNEGISEEISEDIALKFLSIPTYTLVATLPDVVKSIPNEKVIYSEADLSSMLKGQIQTIIASYGVDYWSSKPDMINKVLELQSTNEDLNNAT